MLYVVKYKVQKNHKQHFLDHPLFQKAFLNTEIIVTDAHKEIKRPALLHILMKIVLVVFFNDNNDMFIPVSSWMTVLWCEEKKKKERLWCLVSWGQILAQVFKNEKSLKWLWDRVTHSHQGYVGTKLTFSLTWAKWDDLTFCSVQGWKTWIIICFMREAMRMC